MKNRQIKEQLVQNLKQIFMSHNIVLISHNKGLTVANAKELRKGMKQVGAKYLIAKNTLVKLALEGTNFIELQKMMEGPTSMTYSTDPVSAAKVLYEYAKTNDKLKILGAVMDGKLLDANDVQVLASLPSLDVLRANFIGLLQAPASKIARVLQAPACQVARVLNAYSEKTN